MVKHMVAIIILMAGTFSIGYWFGKNSNINKISFKKYNKKNYK